MVGWSQVVKGFESHTKEWNLSEGFLGFFCLFVCFLEEVFEEGNDISILTLIQSLIFNMTGL